MKIPAILNTRYYLAILAWNERYDYVWFVQDRHRQFVELEPRARLDLPDPLPVRR